MNAAPPPSDLPRSELTRMVKASPAARRAGGDRGNPKPSARRWRRAFGLGAVEALRAEIALEQKPRAIRATGRCVAQIMQRCAVSV